MLLSRTLKKYKTINQKSENSHLKTNSTSWQNITHHKPLNQLTDYQLKLLNCKHALAKDINHPRIRELIYNHEHIQKLISSASPKCKTKQEFKQNITNLQLIEERKWLTKKGKTYLIDFDQNQRKQLKTCFNAMDVQRNGSIGIDELQQLLISVGLMQSREEVKLLIDSVDEDKSGKIQFSQFLKMILNDQGKNQQIVQFFKQIINSNRKKNQQQIEWQKDRSSSKARSKSNENNLSPTKKKVSLIQDKQNMSKSHVKKFSYVEKSDFHEDRNKLYSSPLNGAHNQTANKNSALKIFEKHPHPKNLPFGMVVSHIRRKHMMTALKINQSQGSNLKKTQSLSTGSYKSNHYISNNILRSSQNMKQSKTTNQSKYSEEEVNKGQNVMNALKKMWDRRLLRELRQKKGKSFMKQKMVNCLTDRGRNSKALLPNLM